MDSVLVAAALLSAALHAAWNAAVKSSARPPLAMTAQLLASAALAVPVLCWVGSPAPASWPGMALGWALGSAAITAGYIVFDAQGLRPAERLPQWPRTLLLALTATLSYWLILWAWTRAPIAVTVLKEAFDHRTMNALALATSGTSTIRLGQKPGQPIRRSR